METPLLGVVQQTCLVKVVLAAGLNVGHRGLARSSRSDWLHYHLLELHIVLSLINAHLSRRRLLGS